MKSFAALALLVTLAFPAVAHEEHHHGRSRVDLLVDAVKNKFYLQKRDVPPRDAPYVLMGNKDLYRLDSTFWGATQELLTAAAVDHGHDDSHCEEHLGGESKPGKMRRKAAAVLRAATSFTAWGAQKLRRYGFIAVPPLAAFELAESAVGVHFLCAVGAVVCLSASQELRDLWRSVKYRYPANRNVFARLRLELASNWTQFKYWNSTRTVFKSDGSLVLTKNGYRKYLYNSEDPSQSLLVDTSFWSSVPVPRPPIAIETADIDTAVFERPLRPDLSREQRQFAAEEQIRFLELQYEYAEGAIRELNGQNTGAFIKLSWNLGMQGKALNEYARILRILATKDVSTGVASGDQDLIQFFVAKYQQFLSDLAQYLVAIQSGYKPLNTDYRTRLFGEPIEVSHRLNTFAKSGQVSGQP
jgi:hypothetical protein